MQKTPNGNRIHIGIFGRRNAGKSTFLNFITNQEISLVSEVAGTTTDPVYKAMEIHGLGPVMFIDTAGLDDEGNLGNLRVEKSKKVMEKCDIAIFIFSGKNEEKLFLEEIDYIENLKSKNIPLILLFNKKELKDKDLKSYEKNIYESTGITPIEIILGDEKSKEKILHEIKKKSGYKKSEITGSLVKKGDLAVLVMPQDIQAPEGRLILPQVQTIRELLDKKAVTVCLTMDNLETGLNMLSKEPDIIITDSQVFDRVYELKPENTKLTSFSVLFAALKGDIDYFIKSTEAFSKLNEKSHILICEACTHPPLEEDIGRVKIPNMLRKKYGEMSIDFVRGDDFPKDLKKYDMIIHCGACMFNRKHVISRVKEARRQNVPMTNYGITIAYVKNILPRVCIPE